MTPEVAAYRDKAAKALAEARAMMTLPLPKAGARSAYYAAFHAAEALLLTRTGRIAKTHTGLRSALAETLRNAAEADRALLTFLARAYKYKELSDYGIGDAAVITADEAAALIESVAEFLDRMDALIAGAESGDPSG